MCRPILDSDKRIPRCWASRYIYKVGWTPFPPPCSAPHWNLFQFTFILNRGLDCEPRLLFTGSQDTFVSFHLRDGRGELTYFQLLKLLNPLRLRAPILPSFFIPCLKPSSHSWNRGGPDRSSSSFVVQLHPYFYFCERLVKIRGFESSLSLFFFILYKDCPLFFFLEFISWISFFRERMIELANDISFYSCNFPKIV